MDEICLKLKHPRFFGRGSWPASMIHHGLHPNASDASWMEWMKNVQKSNITNAGGFDFF